MSESQLKKIDGIFKPEKMKIRPSEIKLPEQLSLTWETVGIDNTGPRNGDFLDNIEKYQENRFVNVGENHDPWDCPPIYGSPYLE